MNIVDIACIVFLALWFIIGMKKGFLHGLLRLALVLISLIITYLIFPYVANLVGNLTESTRMDRAVFPVTFLILTIAVNSILGRFIDTLGSSSALSMGNRLLGGVFGTIQGLVYAAAFLVFLSCIVNPNSSIKSYIDTGIVSSNIQKTIVFSYSSLDSIFRKTGINPLLEDLGDMFKG